MARTLDQIKQTILDAKTAEADLNVLTSTSSTAIWKLMINIFAQAAQLLESLWDAKKIELEDLAASILPGTPDWYASEVKRWQYGHGLTESSGKLIYLVQDEAAKLVKAVAVVQGSPLKIKVAKYNSGTLVPLTAGERTSLDSFILDIKFAGTNHMLYSIDPDVVKPTATCYYDGKLDLTTFKTALELALNTYLSGIYFDGNLNKNRYRDAAEAVDGVIDFDLTKLEARTSTGSYAEVLRQYAPLSGYHVHDAAFAAGINYVPQ